MNPCVLVCIFCNNNQLVKKSDHQISYHMTDYKYCRPIQYLPNKLLLVCDVHPSLPTVETPPERGCVEKLHISHHHHHITVW